MNESTLVPREEMSDLDWLARNVHVWVPNELLRMKPCDNRNGTFRASWCYSGDGGFTKDQWLARRAELQNKPSWEEAPEWALSVTQRGNGEWFWLGSTDQFMGPSSSSGCVGEVLGDWRDTLEKRPCISATNCTVTSSGSFGVTVGESAYLSEQAVTARLQEATDNVLSAAPELMNDKYKFEPFVSVEDAKQDIGNLEWLAASIAKWPEIKDWNIKMDRGVSFFDDGVHIYNSDGSDYETIQKRDWEIKVMELNKKPSIQTAKALAEAKLIEDKEPAGVYGVDHFYKPVCTEISEDAATAKQPAPKGSGNPILGMVLADLTNRALEGKEKYGEPLLAHNGRNALWDLYQELLDAAMYIRQAIEEQK